MITMINMHKLIINTCVITCAITFSTLSHGEQFTAKYLTCYDGDTCTINLIKNAVTGDKVLAFFGDSVKIRLAGIDTPEMRGKCAKEKKLAIKARDYLNYILDNAKMLIVDMQERDAFGRYLAHVYADNVDINNLMLTTGYARLEQAGYHDWCK